MINNVTVLAIVPARGGSKRLPRKNVLPLYGKPLITWTIEAGLKSKYIDKVIVTSDDDEILSISKNTGADVIKRPSELASDNATTFDAVKHAIPVDGNYDYIVLLQPTSPLRNEKHIDEAIELLISKRADAVISVCESEHSPLWCNTIPSDGRMDNFIRDEIKNKRSQDLDRYYRLNGAVYICNTKRLLSEGSFILKDNIYAYKMEQILSVDIDSYLDFKLAELVFEEIHCVKSCL